MRLLATAIVSGSLGLIGALPAAAGQSNSYDAPIQLAAGSDATADRTRTLRKASVHYWDTDIRQAFRVVLMPDFPAANAEKRWDAERRLPGSDDKMLSFSWCHNRSVLTPPMAAFHPTLVN